MPGHMVSKLLDIMFELLLYVGYDAKKKNRYVDFRELLLISKSFINETPCLQ